MARQRIRDRRRHCLAIAYLADHDQVRRLAQRRLQADLQGLRVAPDLALVNDGFLVVEEELDRILDRQDVAGHLLVALLEHGGQRRALAGAGRPDHEDEAALLEHERAEDRRNVEAFQRRDLERDAAEDRGDRAALLEAREAKAADARKADADVELARVLELLELARRQQLGEQLARLGVRQRLIGELQQLAVDLDQD